MRFDDWLVSAGSREIQSSNSRSLQVAKIIEALSTLQKMGSDKPQSIAIEEDQWTPIPS